MLTIRIDDISLNTDADKCVEMIKCFEKFLPYDLVLGVSVAVHDLPNERVFPKILNAHSDHKNYFRVDKIGLPTFIKHTKVASHGLFHVDHRLLNKECQEMSILSSCSILKTKLFIPPFNKYNQHTEEICKEHDIELFKFEDGWKHLKYEKFTGKGKYYFHTHDFTVEEFQKRLA